MTKEQIMEDADIMYKALMRIACDERAINDTARLIASDTIQKVLTNIIDRTVKDNAENRSLSRIV